MLPDVDLNQLTEAERDQILQVLRRDDELRKKEQERIRQLKNEVKQLRLRGVIREGQNADKTCARCRQPFGWFFNTGAICPNCQHRVCEKCRQPKDKNTWICVLCFKQMELEAMTNHWFYSKFRKSKRSKKTNRVISGSEIVKASFRKPARIQEDGTLLAGNSLTEEVKRALYNNNPNTPTKSPLDGESSDTQSVEGAPPTKRLDRIAFPEEEDKQLLMELIKPLRPASDGPVVQQHHVEVKRVTSNRYRDSDTDSDSAPSSPQLSSRNESVFAQTDSLRSSLRSSSIVSSDGRITVVTDVGGLSDMEVASVDTMGLAPSPVWDRDEETFPEDGRHALACGSPAGQGTPRSRSSGGSGSNRAPEHASRDGVQPGSNRPRDDPYRDGANRLRQYRGSPQTGAQQHRAGSGHSPAQRMNANAPYTKDSPQRELSVSSTDSESIYYKDSKIKYRVNHVERSRTPSPDDRYTSRENRAPSSDHPTGGEGSVTWQGQTSCSRVSGLPSSAGTEGGGGERDRGQLAGEGGRVVDDDRRSPAALSSSPSTDPDEMGAEGAPDGEHCKNRAGDGSSPLLSRSSPDPIRHKVRALLVRYGKGDPVVGGGLSGVEEQTLDELEPLSVTCPASVSLEPSLPVYLSPSRRDGSSEAEEQGSLASRLGSGQEREESGDYISRRPDEGKEAAGKWSWRHVQGEDDFWAKDDSYYLEDRGDSSSSGQLEWDSDMISEPYPGQGHPSGSEDHERQKTLETLKSSLLAAGFPASYTKLNEVESLEQDPEERVACSEEHLVQGRDAPDASNRMSYVRMVPPFEDEVDSLSVISEKTEPVDSDDDDDELTAKDESSSEIDSIDLDMMSDPTIPDIRSKITVTKVVETEMASVDSSKIGVESLPYQPYHSHKNLPKSLSDEYFGAAAPEQSEPASAQNVMNEVDKNVEKPKHLQTEASSDLESSSPSTLLQDRTTSVEDANIGLSVGSERPDSSVDNLCLDTLNEAEILDALVYIQRLNSPDEPRSQSGSFSKDKSLTYAADPDRDGDDDDDLDSLIDSNREFITEEEMQEILHGMSYDHQESNVTARDKQHLNVPEPSTILSRVRRNTNESSQSHSSGDLDVVGPDAPQIVIEDVEQENPPGVEMRDKPGRSELVDKSPIASVSDLKELFSKGSGSQLSSGGHGTSTPKQEEVWWRGIITAEATKMSETRQVEVDPVPSEAHISPVVSFLKEFEVSGDTKKYVVHEDSKLAELKQGAEAETTKKQAYPDQDSDPEAEQGLTGHQDQKTIVGTMDVASDRATSSIHSEQTREKSKQETIESRAKSRADSPEKKNLTEERQEEENLEGPSVMRRSVAAQKAVASSTDTSKSTIVGDFHEETLPKVDEENTSCDEELLDIEHISHGRSSSFEELYNNLLIEESADDAPGECDKGTKREISPGDNVADPGASLAYNPDHYVQTCSVPGWMLVRDGFYPGCSPFYLPNFALSNPVYSPPNEALSSSSDSGQISFPGWTLPQLCPSLAVDSLGDRVASSTSRLSYSSLSSSNPGELSAFWIQSYQRDTCSTNPGVIQGVEPSRSHLNNAVISNERRWLGSIQNDLTPDSGSWSLRHEEFSNSRDSLDVLVDDASDTAEERTNPRFLPEADPECDHPILDIGSRLDDLRYCISYLNSPLPISQLDRQLPIKRRASHSALPKRKHLKAGLGSVHADRLTAAVTDSQTNANSAYASSSALRCHLEKDKVANEASPCNPSRTPSNLEKFSVVCLSNDGVVRNRFGPGHDPAEEPVNVISVGSQLSSDPTDPDTDETNPICRRTRWTDRHDAIESPPGVSTESAASVANGHLAPPGKQRKHQKQSRDAVDRAPNAAVVELGTSAGQSRDTDVQETVDKRSPTGSLPSSKGVAASPLSNRSVQSAEEDDIDELFQSHASMQSFTDSKRSSNLISPFTRRLRDKLIDGSLTENVAASRESIASYYSDAGEGNYGRIPVTGEVLFGLDYNYKNNVLEIHVKQCRDLAAVDTKKKRSDPYIKTYLLPDKTKSGKRKTKVKKHTLNPTFDEILRYQITKSELENRTLWLTVWHNDTFGRNDFLGEVTVPMDEYTFTKTAPRWYSLQERLIPQTDEHASPMSKLAYKGDLIVSLKFVTCDYLMNKRRGRGGERGELQVLIKEARNLTAVRANGTSDPFCKGYLLPERTKHAKQKTPVKKKDCNPKWNHTFVFEDIAWADLKERCLELTVWDHDRFTSNDFLGGVRLGLGTGTSGGHPVDWMDSTGEEVTIWKSMLERPNVWIDGTLILRPSMDSRK